MGYCSTSSSARTQLNGVIVVVVLLAIDRIYADAGRLHGRVIGPISNIYILQGFMSVTLHYYF